MHISVLRVSLRWRIVYFYVLPRFRMSNDLNMSWYVGRSSDMSGLFRHTTRLKSVKCPGSRNSARPSQVGLGGDRVT